jgi:hypothetical protein
VNVENDLVDVLRRHIAGQPRNHQTRIGPSEIGVPCERRIGYKTVGVPEVNDRGVAWKPWVGTALHSETAMAFELDSLKNHNGGRWLLEEKVTAGQVNGTDLDGSCDLFDVHSGTVVDWKFTTRNKLRDYRAHGPGDQYRAQAHTYGLGWANRGYPVLTVGVFFFTRDGEFTDRLFWSEPYQEQVATAAIARADRIAALTTSLGPALALPLLGTADAYCTYCPWHRPGSTDLAAGCPGDTATQERLAPPNTLAESLFGAN